MRDIEINGNRLSIVEGDLKLIDGKDRIIQQVMVGLKIFPGDWFLDYRIGTDYIGGLKAYPTIMKSQIKTAMERVWGVERVSKFTFTKTNNVYNVTANIIANNNEYNLSAEYSL